MVMGVEQIASADLLAVMLFAMLGGWLGKKACQRAQAAELHRYMYHINAASNSL